MSQILEKVQKVPENNQTFFQVPRISAGEQIRPHDDLHRSEVSKISPQKNLVSICRIETLKDTFFFPSIVGKVHIPDFT